MADADWQELAAITRKHYPRLEARFGVCPVCGLTATALGVWPPCTWSLCQPCGTRWHAGTNLLEISEDQFADAFALDDDMPQAEFEDLRGEVLFQTIAMLAEFQDLGASAPLQGDRNVMAKTPSVVLEPCRFDFHDFQGPKEGRLFPDSNREEREGLTAAVVPSIRYQSIRRHPTTGAAICEGLDVWDQIRDKKVAPRVTVEQLVARPSNGFDHLSRLTYLLVDLRDQRAALEKKLAALDVINRAFSTDAASLTTGGAHDQR